MRLALAQCDGDRWAIDILADHDPDHEDEPMPDTDQLVEFFAPAVEWLSCFRPGILLVPIPEVIA